MDWRPPRPAQSPWLRELTPQLLEGSLELTLGDSCLHRGLNPQTSRNDVRIICIPLPLPAWSSWDPASPAPWPEGWVSVYGEEGWTLVSLDGGGTTGPPASWAQPGPLPIQPPLQSSFNFLFLRKRGAAP